MPLQVFTAVTGAAWESALVGALDRDDHGVAVVRRCVDVGELLAAAATGTGQAALLSADLRRLDGAAVARLQSAGVAVVGLVEPGDDGAADRLRQLGVTHVLPADAGAEAIAQELREAVAGGAAPGRDVADPRAALPATGFPERPQQRPAGRGRVVAVWGPLGAPGRTTVAVGVADEAARLGVDTLLVDADVYGGVVAQVLGLLDESPGLAGAARQATTGALDTAGLGRLAWAVRPQLRVTAVARRNALWGFAPPMPRWVQLLTPARPAWGALVATAAGMLPRWARRLYGLPGLPTTDLTAVVTARAIRRTMLTLPSSWTESPIRRTARERLTA